MVIFRLTWAQFGQVQKPAIPNLCPAEALWLSFNIRLYVLLTKWNEQTHWPNMLHHTERVGLSYRINNGRGWGWWLAARV